MDTNLYETLRQICQESKNFLIAQFSQLNKWPATRSFRYHLTSSTILERLCCEFLHDMAEAPAAPTQ
jgi:hypothetical protein